MLQKSILSFLLAGLFQTGHAFPSAIQSAKPPAFFLAGDSTTATNGGWGDGFLNTTLINGAWGINFGHSGTTTSSFRSGGDWDDVLAAAKNASTAYTPYITIQFGHNDQKSDDGLAVFEQNLVTFVQEARDAGATPILLTSLTRRDFDTSVDPPVLEDNLANVRNLTIEAADESSAELVHLNEESAAYVTAIGEDDAYKYNLDGTDRTHLNDDGSIVFGGLVAKLLLENNPDRSDFLEVDADLLEALDDGVYYDPE